MKKTVIMVLTLILVVVIIAGCADTDVVLKYSQSSLDEITKAFPDLISYSDGYSVLTVDGMTSLKTSNDFNAGKDDILFETPLAPFVRAGLDVSNLPEGYKAEGDGFYLTTDYGAAGKKDNVLGSLFEAVKTDRTLLSYHKDLDHYGVALTRGKFEWAKDHTKNDKDIVFVIGAKPLAELGVDVKNIEGWVFLTMKDEGGKDVDVLVKPYDLK